MKPDSTRIDKYGFVVVLCLAIFGCQADLHVKPTVDYTPSNSLSSQQKIPMRVALYINPSVREFISHSNMGFTVDIGNAIASGAEQAMIYVFTTVTTSDKIGANLDLSSTDAIITPEIVDSHLSYIRFQTYSGDVTCKWTITRPDGRIIYLNTFTGNSEYKLYSINRSKLNSQWSECMELAVKDQYNKLVSDLLSGRWLKAIQ